MRLLLDWHGDPWVIVGLTAVGLGWLWLERRGVRVSTARRRAAAAAYGVSILALTSPLAAAADRRFAAHMVQHLALTYLVGPLVAFVGPMTLLLQALPAGRRRRIAALLHSAPLRLVSHPVALWLLFTLVMYFTHFSPLYDEALRSPAVHGLEHVLYLASSVLFWSVVIRQDPATTRLSWPARLLFVLVAMPYQSFLGVAIIGADAALYSRYVEQLGPAAALGDQQLAGAIMWVGGDLLLLTALGLMLAAWMRHDERETVRLDARLDAARRDAQLHARLSAHVGHDGDPDPA